MKLDVWLKTYNGVVGHPDLLLVGDLLFPKSSPSFGDAITAFEVYAHVDLAGQPLPGLEAMLGRFRERVTALPRSWFRRKQRLIEVAYPSRLGSAPALFENKRTPADVVTIRMAYGEIADVLEQQVLKSVKRSDDFDSAGFATFLRSRRATLDGVPDVAMHALLERLRASAPAHAVPPVGVAGTSHEGASSAVGVPAPSADHVPPRPRRASSRPPTIIAINHDDHHAKHVGRTADGQQFFLTTPFVPANGEHPGREFVSLFLFDSKGKLLGAMIDDLGPRAELEERTARRLYDARLAELGRVALGRIEVAPFSVQHSGIKFGLIVREPEHDGDAWAVEMQPGNYMAFFEPWDSGDYDT